MILFNPHEPTQSYPDERSSEVMRLLVEFFEAKGLARIQADDHAATWYQDDDGDEWGVESSPTTACDQPSGFAADSGDCDDADGTVNPGAV